MEGIIVSLGMAFALSVPTLIQTLEEKLERRHRIMFKTKL